MFRSAVGSTLVVIATAAMPVLAGVALGINHQGVVAVQGERFTGQGLFRFAVVDPATDAYLWTNDGSAVIHPDPPTSAATLTTINGVYNVLLGDPSLPNMTFIPPSVFSVNQNTALRVWFDDQENGLHPLAPDLKIAASPYAVQSRSSEQLNIPGEDTAAVFVDAIGNVGVGTTSPDSTLDVGAPNTTQINVTSGMGNAVVLLKSDDTGDAQIYSPTQTDDLRVFVGGADRITVGPDGNVGIGTTTPEARLEVAGGADDGVAVISGFNTSTLFLKRDGGGFDAALSNQAGAAPFVFFGGGATGETDPTTLPELMRVTSAGKVGIGTIAPSQALDVNGDIAIQGQNFASYDGANTFKIGDLLSDDGNVSNFEIRTNDEARLTVDGAGNVGIGTGSPDGSLEIEDATARITTESTGGGFNFSGLRAIQPGMNFFSGTCVDCTGATGENWVVFDNGPPNTTRLRINESGNVHVNGTLSKGAGSFVIDHPLDPANKFLYHSFVESPDMMNIYNGVAVLDADGAARIRLPEWFDTLNRDYRYQLTPIGAPAPNLHIARELADNRFAIAGGRPGIKVSWQITGVRMDPFANANRIPVEVEKTGSERGVYIHPEAYGIDPRTQPGISPN